MNKQRVIDAITIIKNECDITSCDYCCFNKNGDCKLTQELIGAPCAYEVEELEECSNE